MLKILKLIKKGEFANVIAFDRFNINHHAQRKQLRYSPDRHKFYLSEDERGLHRVQITSKQADILIRKTWIHKDMCKKLLTDESNKALELLFGK